MTFERHAEHSLDYELCQYDGSPIRFRGPRPDLTGDYIAFAGSTETFGKFVERPYPALVGERLEMPALNLGCVNGGVELLNEDQVVLDLCRGARACVVQAMAPHRLSNRLYSVHPRRNDRFVMPSELLRSMYPEVDLTDIHFTRHLMAALYEASPERFALVREELSSAWLRRMQRVIERITVPVVLLWLSERAPEEGGAGPSGCEPLFVSRDMVERLRPAVAAVVEIRAAPAAGEVPADGLVWSELERAAARTQPGPAAHEAAAASLIDALTPLVDRLSPLA